MPKAISVENLGPIAELGFSLESPGVTVLVAPNGSGKSILLDAVQSAARGSGKLPLRDRTRRGKVEAFGATITIGGTCRHTGEFEVTHLEGKFDLAGLVDPRIKKPELADAARIKALVALTGVEASIDLFRRHEAFQNFDRVVKAASVQIDDLCEMARRIKSDYDEAARSQEDEAEREIGKSEALKAPADLDLKSPHDLKALQAEIDRATQEGYTLQERRRLGLAAEERRAAARERIAGLKAQGIDSKIQLHADRKQKASLEAKELEAGIAGLEETLRRSRLRLSQLTTEIEECGAMIVTLTDLSADLAEQMEIVNAELEPCPTEEELQAAADRLQDARAAYDNGLLVGRVLQEQKTAADHRKKAAEASRKAAQYRDSGKATDEVLSASIKCQHLRVESDGKSARLVADTNRGKSIPFHELSEGERWKIAIDIGADQVGEGGLLVIDQIGWEGIDGKNRQLIHERAVERGVYILTAEAAADPEADREIVPTPFEAVA